MSFELMHQSNSIGFSVHGPVIAAPDSSLFNLEAYVRSKLPGQIDRLIFKLYSDRNFYYGHDLFIANEEVRQYLIDFSGATFHERPINCVDRAGASIKDKYWALMISNELDCLDAKKSTKEKAFSSYPPPEVSLADEIIEYTLDDSLASEFANCGENIFRSYRRGGIKKIVLKNNLIPKDVKMFRIKYWPGYYFIESMFSEQLLRMCDGGTPGYYFWALNLDNVQGSLNHLMIALR